MKLNCALAMFVVAGLVPAHAEPLASQEQFALGKPSEITEQPDDVEVSSDPSFWSNPQWRIERSQSSCTLYSEIYRVEGEHSDGSFSQISQLMISFDTRRDEVKLYLFVPGATSLISREERYIKFVLFDENIQFASIYDEYFPVVALKWGNQSFLRGIGKSDTLEILSRYGAIGFLTDNDRVINAFKLEGFHRALAELRACAGEQMQASPSDPFAP